MRILVIEDDAALASYIRKGLQAEHYAVDVALDGEQGSFMATDLDFDLLVLDLNLPKLDGISVLRNLRPKQASTTRSSTYCPSPRRRSYSCPGQWGRTTV